MNIDARSAAPPSFSRPPPQWGGVDLNSSSRGCARLGSGVAPFSFVLQSPRSCSSCAHYQLKSGYDLWSASQARQFRLKIDPVRDAVARYLVQTGETSQIRGSLQ